MKYLLDLTDIDHTHYLHGLKIQCTLGQYEKDFDIDECDLPRATWQYIKDRSAKTSTLPFGFNKYSCAKGSRLMMIEDEKTKADFRSMYFVPKDCTEFGALMEDGTVHSPCHWASDLSGECQPVFRGYFIKSTSGFRQIETPIMWRPLQQ
jgi:hypothetical protein